MRDFALLIPSASKFGLKRTQQTIRGTTNEWEKRKLPITQTTVHEWQKTIIVGAENFPPTNLGPTRRG